MNRVEDYISYIEKENEIDYDSNFEMVSYCTKLLSLSNEEGESAARKIAIHILNNWEKIDSSMRVVWREVIETLGFYPYIQENRVGLEGMTFADEVRRNYFQSDYLDNTFFHKEQKKLSSYLLEGKSVIASAPTSFGKSLLIEEIVASKRYKNIVIIQPTLALLDETRQKLKKYSDEYKIIVRTSQPASKDKGNLFLLTAERVMEYESLPHIDFFVIDEFYKLSLRRKDERADTLNSAFLKIVDKYKPLFYFLGPNIDGISAGFAQKYNAVFYKSNFSLVDCDVIDKSYLIDSSLGKVDDQRNRLLCELLYELKDEQTLIYCSSPARARKMAKKFLEYLQSKGVEERVPLPLVEWIEKNISPKWSLAAELRHGIAVHDGSLQKHICASVINYFNSGKLSWIFCTSTIIEGVNTSAKNVVLFDEKRGPNLIDFFDYSNIKGRSGRLMEHYVGKVYNFCHAPEQKAIEIDIPFFEQDPEVLTDEILINIKKEDVSNKVIDRYNQINSIPPDLLKIIKQNGVSVKGQFKIYEDIIRDLESGNSISNITWTQFPTWEQLGYVLQLAQDRLFDFSQKKAIFSTSQLQLYLNMYRNDKNIISIVKDIYENKIKNRKKLTEEKKAKDYDAAIEEAFHIYRHWFQFTVPKVFRVVDSIQRLICEKRGIKPGSYSFFVQQLENDFIRENLSILVEYGVPSNAVRRIESIIPENLSEDAVIEYIKKNKDAIQKHLFKYEIERIEQCI
ncbi:MAG: DEAD/DEAH box helicase [Lachnospiraceae bacterium]|nr:DEAD/DEAH box helicase [Lachnospiraceae bacterium]